MVSYIKTQWWRLLCALLCWIPIIITACTSTATSETLEGLATLVRELITCGSWMLASCFWCIMSIVDHNSECIKKLNERIQLLESRAVTDIDKVSDNNYIVRRRLGADKDEPYPEEDKK
jgi:hypothetical protein